MRTTITKYLGLLLLLAAANLSYGQLFNKLYDNDSTSDWGSNVFTRIDNSSFLTGGALDPITNKWSLITMTISADGNTIINRHRFTNNYASLYSGTPEGTGKQLTGGGYLTPVTIQYPNPVTGYLYSAGGMIKYNDIGDTVFLKTYTATSIYFDLMSTCAVMQNGDYIVGGGHALNTPSYYPAYLMRTDSMGDTLWTHTYQKSPAQSAEINTIEALDNGRILVGAMSTVDVPTSFGTLGLNGAWFLILDSAGNVIKDTLYDYSSYAGGGHIYKDKNGGYIHFGYINSLVVPDPSDLHNFPLYIAHLDTDFHIEWLTTFPYTEAFGHRYCGKVIQTLDSAYVLVGDVGLDTLNPMGWAAKVDRGGHILWNHYYLNDSTQDAYLRDVAERPDGSLVFTGATYNDTLPAWHQYRDVWLVSTDSNGCELPGCAPDTTTTATNVPATAAQTGELKIWPNPTKGAFTVKVSSGESEDALVTITNILGTKVKELITITNKETAIQLNAPPGIYLISVNTQQGCYVRKMLVQ